jgi:hypothetical protein
MADVYVTFPSLMHPTEFGYAFDSESWRRDNGGVEAKFRMFYTYGDGLTKHSNDWAVTYEYLGDYLASLAQFMLANRPPYPTTNDEDPTWTETERQRIQLARSIGYIVLERPPLANIEFAASIIWKESDDEYGKYRYYSLAEKKITRNKEKQHDKRYHRIERSDDGSSGAILRIIRSEHTDGMELLCYATAIKEWTDTQPDKWCDSPARLLGWWKDDPNESRKKAILHYGFDAIKSVALMYQSERAAYCDLGNYLRSYVKRAEEEKQKQLTAETEAA